MTERSRIPFEIGKNLGKEGTFLEKIEWSGATNNGIYEAEKNKGLVVKKYTEVSLELIKEHLEVLEKSLPAFLPRHQLVIAESVNGDKVTYMIMDKVISERISEDQIQNYCIQLDQLIYESLNVYENYLKNPNHRTWIPDIMQRNIKWGNTQSDPKNRLYLVDITTMSQNTLSEVNILMIEPLIKPYISQYSFSKTKNKLNNLYSKFS